MKWLWMTVCGVGLVATIAYAQNQADRTAPEPKEQQTQLNTVQEKVSYGYGLNQGRMLRQGGVDLDPKLVARGFADAFSDRDPLLTEEQLEAAFQEFQKEMAAKQAEQQLAADPELKAEAEKNKKQGEAFLAENKKKEGVETLDSGLQYQVLESGTGDSPTAADTVKTHYHGTLIDGTVFDSSVERGEPATFPVSGVIEGWTEALQLMKVGDKWRLFVPSDLAYGLSPRPGGPIGPNAVLIFEVELLDIVNE